MFSQIINKFQSKPNFNHKIGEWSTTLPTLPEPTPITYHTLLINYTEAGCFTSHYYTITSRNPGKFLHSTDLSSTITDSETGEMLGEFYGFNNPDFLRFLDQLIDRGQKFDIWTKWGTNPTNIMHGEYRRLKSGRWKKRTA